MVAHLLLPNHGGTGLNLPFNNLTWIALVLFSWLGLERIAEAELLTFSRGTALLFGAILTSITAFPILNTDLWPGTFAALWLGLLCYSLLDKRQASRLIPLLLWLLVGAGVIESAFGLLNNFGISPSFGSTTEVEASQLESFRPSGVFQQPNVLASFLATSLAACGVIISTRSHVNKVDLQKISTADNATSILKQLLSGLPHFTIALCTAILIITASRTGWIALITVLGFVTLHLKSRRQTLYPWLAPATIGLLLGGLLLATNPGNQDLADRKSNLESSRAELYPQVLRMIADKPLLGYGGGNFEKAYVTHAAAQHAADPSKPPAMTNFDHPHNELLFWAVEGGVLPVLGIVGFMGWLLWCIRRMPGERRWLALALLTPLLLHNLLEYPFRHSAPHWLTFLLIVYIIDRWADTPVTTVNISRWAAPIRVFGLVLLVLGSATLVNALVVNWALWKVEIDPERNASYLRYAAIPGPMQERYDFVLNGAYYKLGMKNNDRMALQLVNDWAFEQVKITPRVNVYHALIETSVKLGDIDRAKEAIAEVNYYFPQMEHPQLIPVSDASVDVDMNLKVQSDNNLRQMNGEAAIDRNTIINAADKSSR